MKSLFANIMKEYEGYKIGKMLCYIQDPEIISFAGGLPSNDVFPLDLIQKTAKKSLKLDPEHVLQYLWPCILGLPSQKRPRLLQR